MVDAQLHRVSQRHDNAKEEQMSHKLGRLASIVLALFLLAATTGTSGMEREKHDDIQHMLQLTGALSIVKQTVDLMLPRVTASFKKINPNIPEKIWTEAQDVARVEIQLAVPELEEPLIAIYDANFTGEEIKQLLAFYESPVGRKIVSQQPAMLQQIFAVSQVWGQKISERVAARIRAHAKQKGYDL
jgi:hypothetical protein